MYSDTEMEKIYKQSLHPDMIEDETPVKSDFRAKTYDKLKSVNIGHNVFYKKENKKYNPNAEKKIYKILQVIAIIVLIMVFVLIPLVNIFYFGS